MRIESNIGGVVERLRRFEAGLDGASERVVSPERWVVFLKGVAERALARVQSLRSRGDAERRSYVSEFVEAISAVALAPNGFEMGMTAPVAGRNTGTIEAGQNVAGIQTGRRFGPTEQGILADAEAAVERFVREEKDLDEEEQGMPIAAVVERVNWIVFHYPEAEGTGKLVKAIEEWLAEESGTGMSAQDIEAYLRVVLEAWREAVLRRLPGLAREEIRKWWRECEGRLV